jgi:hypothetical protein
MKTPVHGIAGSLALLCILSFWTATVVSETLLSDQAIVAVKHGILYGMLLLVPAIAAAGGSGFSLAAGRSGRRVERKRRRMPIIAANGLVILVPAAFFLYAKAAAGEFDPLFYAVQVLELIAGAVNLTLMGLNLRDGLVLTGRLHPVQPAS